MTLALLRNRLTDLVSDIRPIPLWDTVTEGSVPLNEGDAQTGRLRMTGFAGLQIFPNVLITGGVTTVNVRVRTSSLDDPDPANPAHWINDDDAQALPVTASPGLQTAVIVTVDASPQWVSLQVWTDGEPVGTSQLALLVRRLVSADVPVAAPGATVAWNEITDAEIGGSLVNTGGLLVDSLGYVGDRWRVVLPDQTVPILDGASEGWPYVQGAFANIVSSGFNWRTHGLEFLIEWITNPGDLQIGPRFALVDTTPVSYLSFGTYLSAVNTARVSFSTATANTQSTTHGWNATTAFRSIQHLIAPHQRDQFQLLISHETIADGSFTPLLEFETPGTWPDGLDDNAQINFRVGLMTNGATILSGGPTTWEYRLHVSEFQIRPLALP